MLCNFRSHNSLPFHINALFRSLNGFLSVKLCNAARCFHHKCVFKGGTSLSKGFHVLNRFSEDIDITFTERLGEARRKKLKYNIMKQVSEELGMPISNWNKIESDKDYKCYIFQYESLDAYAENGLSEGVKVETALASYSFPTEKVNIDSYVRQYLEIDNRDVIEEFELSLFEMNLQTISRTYIDKVLPCVIITCRENQRDIPDICMIYIS